MKDMYVIEKNLHHIGGIEIKIANADLFDAESGEWVGHVAKDASEAKLEFWYRDASGKVRFIVEMDEYDGTAVYDVSAKIVAKELPASPPASLPCSSAGSSRRPQAVSSRASSGASSASNRKSDSDIE